MSGVNLDRLSDEQIDELVAGCRSLRALRERYVESSQQPLPGPHEGFLGDSLVIESTEPKQKSKTTRGQ